MWDTHSIQGFVGALRYHDAHPKSEEAMRQGRPFITISRQAGAGGHSLAQELIKAMAADGDPLLRQWQILDQELCQRLVEDAAFRVSDEELRAERYHSPIEEFLLETIAGRTPQEVVIRKTFHLVRTLASMGKVIIVGRAGVCVTRPLPGGVHVRLVAPELCRVKRLRVQRLLSEESVRLLVRQQDHERARLLRDFFNKDINDPLLYDVVWNTDAVSLPAIAQAILCLVRHRVREEAHATRSRAPMATVP